MVFREMRITHGHSERLVSHELLDRKDRHVRHSEPGAERVAQIVEMESFQPGPLKQRIPVTVEVRQEPALRSREDVAVCFDLTDYLAVQTLAPRGAKRAQCS